MYLLFFVQRVDGVINLLFSKTTIQWISVDIINYTIPAGTGQQGLVWLKSLAKTNKQFGSLCLHLSYITHVIWSPKNRHKEQSARVIPLPAPPPPWSLDSDLVFEQLGRVKNYVYTFQLERIRNLMQIMLDKKTGMVIYFLLV